LKVKNYVRRAVLLGCLLTLITYGLNVAIVAHDMIDDEWRGLERESGRLSFQIRKRLEVLDRSLSRIAIKVGEVKAGQSNADMQGLIELATESQPWLRNIVIVDAAGVIRQATDKRLIGLAFAGQSRYRRLHEEFDPLRFYLFERFRTPLGNSAVPVVHGIAEPATGGFGGYILGVVKIEDFAELFHLSSAFVPGRFFALTQARRFDQPYVVIHGTEKELGNIVREVQSAGLQLQAGVSTRYQAPAKSRSWSWPGEFYVATLVRPPAVEASDQLPLLIGSHERIVSERLGEYVVKSGTVVLLILLAVVLAYWTWERHYMTRYLAAVDQATLDGLTGLANRRAADDRLRGEFLRMKRSAGRYAVLMIDIDHFKQVNDSHGHAAGDEVLRRVASEILRSVRETDFVARFGGEEFLAILPYTDAAGARMLAEKIRVAVAEADMPAAGRVHVSVGVAIAGPADEDEAVAVALADARLYAAKAAGRNRVMD
jgi:diguanylate cyclase (GGDEF)-like protein